MLGRRRRRRTNTRPTLVKYLVFDGLHILAPKLVHRSAITVVRDCTEEGLLTKSGLLSFKCTIRNGDAYNTIAGNKSGRRTWKGFT